MTTNGYPLLAHVYGLFLFLFWLMVHPMVILHLKEDSVKGIPYPLICFYYVQKGYTLLQQKQDSGTLHRVSLCRDGPKVTHLFFAGDSMLFCKASQQECTTILEILQLYEAASGQQINRDKTQLFFNSNTDQAMRDQIKTSIGVLATTHTESYLSVPSFMGKAKKQRFGYIREWIWHKIQGWKEKLLSQGGREILIKAVLQAMPTMGCFLLPKSLCKDIEALILKFWWGYKGEARKIHWVAWKNLCLPKNNGGLGFKDIVNYNLPLLGKQVWRLFHNTDSLLYKVFKSKYFPNCSILDDEVKIKGLYAWQGILKGR